MIYKICEQTDWQAAVNNGHFPGAAVDLQDGFIHFSTAVQVRDTAARHFSGQSGLLLIEFDENDFGEELKWEVSRGGDRFPHLYSALDVSRARNVWELPVAGDGRHEFPRQMEE